MELGLGLELGLGGGSTTEWHDGLFDADGAPIDGTGVHRINGNLAVARSIGDRFERPYVTDEASGGRFGRCGRFEWRLRVPWLHASAHSRRAMTRDVTRDGA